MCAATRTAEHLMDGGYPSAVTIAASARRGITLVAPVTGRNAQKGTFAPADVTIDWDAGAAICPGGATNRSMKPDKWGLVTFAFSRRDCRPEGGPLLVPAGPVTHPLGIPHGADVVDRHAEALPELLRVAGATDPAAGPLTVGSDQNNGHRGDRGLWLDERLHPAPGPGELLQMRKVGALRAAWRPRSSVLTT